MTNRRIVGIFNCETQRNGRRSPFGKFSFSLYSFFDFHRRGELRSLKQFSFFFFIYRNRFVAWKIKLDPFHEASKGFRLISGN